MRGHVLHVVLALLSSTLLAFGGQMPDPPEPTARVQLRVPILMYHYVSANPRYPDDPVRTRLSVTPAAFAAQLRYLRKAGYTTITLDDLVRALRDHARLPPKPVILTFDDGYQDFFDNAFPLLKRFDDRATVYIITGKVGHAGYMTWKELRALSASPLMTIGAHTRTHPDLARLTARRSWDELAGSKADLEARLGTTVRHLSYPSGEYSPATIEQAAAIGFETAVTTHEGLDERADVLLTLDRVRINGYTGLSDLIEGLAGQRAPTRRAPSQLPLKLLCNKPATRSLDECQALRDAKR